jgi:hypothetical protein
MCALVANAEVYVYPSKGQTQEQQQSDQGECRSWASKNTGVNPSAAPPQRQSAAKKQGGVLKGAVVGAAIRGVTGGDAGTGAAIGGVFGGVRQANKNNSAQQQTDAQYQQQMAQYQQGQANYGRAYAACLEGRGYNVK